MSSINDAAKSGSRFEATVRKHRGLLTKEERRLMALAKGVEQAALVVRNAKDAVDRQEKRAADAEAELAARQKEFEAAKAELEASK